MYLLKRLVFVLLVSFGISSNANAFFNGCITLAKAWDRPGQQGEEYVFGFGNKCTKNSAWNNKISSIKVRKDFMLRVCEDHGMKGSCIFGAITESGVWSS